MSIEPVGRSTCCRGRKGISLCLYLYVCVCAFVKSFVDGNMCIVQFCGNMYS